MIHPVCSQWAQKVDIYYFLVAMEVLKERGPQILAFSLSHNSTKQYINRRIICFCYFVFTKFLINCHVTPCYSLCDENGTDQNGFAVNIFQIYYQYNCATQAPVFWKTRMIILDKSTQKIEILREPNFKWNSF